MMNTPLYPLLTPKGIPDYLKYPRGPYTAQAGFFETLGKMMEDNFDF